MTIHTGHVIPMAKLTVFLRARSITPSSRRTPKFGRSVSIVGEGGNFSSPPNSPSKSKAENYDGLPGMVFGHRLEAFMLLIRCLTTVQNNRAGVTGPEAG